MSSEGPDNGGKIKRFPESPSFLRELDEALRRARKFMGTQRLKVVIERKRRQRTEADAEVQLAALDAIEYASEEVEVARDALKSDRLNKLLLENARKAKDSLEEAVAIAEQHT